jgi:hypothetical protein
MISQFSSRSFPESKVPSAASLPSFGSSSELLQFAKAFFRGQVRGFRKDICICLTQNGRGEHAYFPALIRCISFLDLLGGLHAGDIVDHKRAQLLAYAKRFMDINHYDELRLSILYEGFRHKIAHLSDPYPVFDTGTKKKVFDPPYRRITWTVYASKRPIPIELIAYPKSECLKNALHPWPVSYDHRIKISLRRFANDITKSIYSPDGYLKHLQSDRTAQRNFERAMQVFYSP